MTTAITGSTASAVIILNGADFVTIDGSNNGTSSRDLTITNTDPGTSSAVVWLQTAGADAATNNTIKNVNLVGNGNTTTLFGVGSGSSTISLASLGTGNNGNTIQNNNISKVQFGIYSQGASAASKNSGNVITKNVMTTASPNGIGKGGILVGFENGIQITENAISDISNGVSSFDAFGISLGFSADLIAPTGFTGNEVTNATVSRNTIGSVAHTATYSATGIAIASAASGTTLVVNNVITGVTANSTAGNLAAGIFAGGGAGSTTQIFFNSISMTGDRGSGTSLPSYALAIGGSNPTVDARDNILFNSQTTSGTGKSYAVGLAYSTFTNLTSDNNDLFVSGANTFIGQTGGLGTIGTDHPTLASFAGATSKDINSITVDPQFTSTTNLQPAPASPVLDAGTSLAAFVTPYIDITGRTRTDSPSQGAFDLTGPDILYVPLPNTGTTSARSLTATITDFSGVPIVGIGLPVLYWKINNAPSYASAQGTAIGSNDYQFTFGAGVSQGDTVSYYIAAQDNRSRPNVALNPDFGASSYDPDPPRAGSLRTRPTPTSFSRISPAPSPSAPREIMPR